MITSSRTETLTDEEGDEINLLLYTKERFNVSNEAYHELSMTCNDLPRSWKMQEMIKTLNSKWNLEQTPGDTFGVLTTKHKGNIGNKITSFN